MDMEHINGSLDKATTAASANFTPFTFVPFLAKLPTKSRIIDVGGKLLKSLNPNQSLEEPDRDLLDETMDGGVYKAEFVYIRDSEGTEQADSSREPTHAKRLKAPSTDLSAQTPPSPPPPPSPSTPVPTLSKKTICHFGNSSPASPCATMETKTGKHEDFSSGPGCCNTFPGTSADIIRGLYFNHESEPEPELERDEPLSPATSVDLLTSPVSSSRESILSEGWDRDKSWSTPYLPSPAPSSLSRTWSPCSSVRSGAFSPAVVRVTRHSLAPGASLVQLAPGGNGSRSSSRAASRGASPCPCPSSPSPRRRPPPTKLSLLTAILRKGRLPVLSTSVQRPYSPCWPISPVHMSSCPACRAAARVGPVVGGASTPQDLDSAHLPHHCRSSHTETPELKPLHLAKEPQCLSPRGEGVHSAHTSISRTEPFKSCASSGGTAGSRLYSSAMRTFTPEKLGSDGPQNMNILGPVNAEICVSPAPSPQLYTSFSRLSRSVSPKPSYAYCCASEGLDAKSQPCHKGTAQPQSNARLASEHVSDDARRPTDKPSSATYAYRLSPLPRIPPPSSPCRTPTPTSASVSPAPCLPALKPSSCPPTPDRFTLSPSPSTLSRDLTPSPSFPPSSTPTPTLKGRVSVSADREDKKSQPYKIKSSYKTLAAIPTNTLLLEQQAIDDEVDKKENSADPSETSSMEEARAEMCSPAQLRAQSEELYAAIDEVLESPIPFRRPLLSPSPTTHWEETDSAKKYTPRSSPRTAGRETKYAVYRLQSPDHTEQHVTKPGVIRPASVTSRLPMDNEEEEYFPNPFKTYLNNHPSNNPKKFASSLVGEPEADGGRPPSTQSLCKNLSSGGKTLSSLPPSLRLTTTEEFHSAKETAPSTLSTTLAKMELHETDI